jgi:hypothetical protein
MDNIPYPHAAYHIHAHLYIVEMKSIAYYINSIESSSIC